MADLADRIAAVRNGVPSFQLLAAQATWSAVQARCTGPIDVRLEPDAWEDAWAIVMRIEDFEVWLYADPYDTPTIAWIGGPRPAKIVEFGGRGAPPFAVLDEIALAVVSELSCERGRDDSGRAGLMRGVFRRLTSWLR